MGVRLGGGRGTGAYNPDENLKQPSVIVNLMLRLGIILGTYVTIFTFVRFQIGSSDVSSIFRKGILSIEKKQALL